MINHHISLIYENNTKNINKKIKHFHEIKRKMNKISKYFLILKNFRYIFSLKYQIIV